MAEEETVEQQEFPVSGKGISEEQAPAIAPANPKPDFSALAIGDRCHFVLQDGLREGECRPFDITRITDRAKGLVNGRVATDFHDFGGAGQDGLFIEDCSFSAEHKPGSWHKLHA